MKYFTIWIQDGFLNDHRLSLEIRFVFEGI